MDEPVAWTQNTFCKYCHRIPNQCNCTHPVKELNDGGEPVKNATYWKRQYNLMATQNDNLKSGLYHANEQIKYLESNPVKELKNIVLASATCSCGKVMEVTNLQPVKELTEEEMKDLIQEYWGDVHIVDPDGYLHEIAFIRAILRKAQEK